MSLFSTNSQRQKSGKYERVATDELHGNGPEDERFQTVHLSSEDSDPDSSASGASKVSAGSGAFTWCRSARDSRPPDKEQYTFMEDLRDTRVAPAKLFYLIMGIGGGFLVPFMPVYFRQLGLTTADSGVLSSLPMFISFWSAPLWTGIADKYRCVRSILVLSLLSYAAFHACMYAIPSAVSPPGACLVAPESHSLSGCQNPLTRGAVVTTVTRPAMTSPMTSLPLAMTTSSTTSLVVTSTTLAPTKYPSAMVEQVNGTGGIQFAAGSANLTINGTSPDMHIDSKLHSKAFVVALLLVLLAHLFGGALHSTADTAVLALLDGDKKIGESRYGKQRLWGAAGFALGNSMSGSWADAEADSCGSGNYIVHFSGFAIFMVLSAIIAGIYLFPHRRPKKRSGNEAHSQATESIQIISGLRMIFSRPRPATFFSAVLCLAVARGFDSFVVWFLKDLCASETLIGWALFMRAAAEVPMFLLSDQIIARLGHIATLYVVFATFVVRISCYALLPGPGWALPLEILTGVSWSLIWSCAVQYGRSIASPGLQTSVQGVLSGIWYGLGSGIGNIVCGILYRQFGPRATYALSAAWCLATGVIFTFSQFLISRRENVERSEAEQNDFFDSDDNIEFDQATVSPHTSKQRPSASKANQSHSKAARPTNGNLEHAVMESSMAELENGQSAPSVPAGNDATS